MAAITENRVDGLTEATGALLMRRASDYAPLSPPHTPDETSEATADATEPSDAKQPLSWWDKLRTRLYKNAQEAKAPRRPEQTLGDAVLLMEYAVQHSDSIDKTLISEMNACIIEARQAGFREFKVNGKYTGDLSAAYLQDAVKLERFYMTYDRLSKHMSPVTAESIRSSRYQQSNYFGWLPIYLVLAALMFVLFLYLQFSWSVGNRYLTEVREAYDTKVTKEREWMSLKADVERLERSLGIDAEGDTAGLKDEMADEVRQRRAVREKSLTDYVFADKTLISRLPLLGIWRDHHVCQDAAYGFGDCLRHLAGQDRPVTAGENALGTPPFDRDRIASDMVGIATPMVERLNSHVIPAILGLLGSLVFVIRQLAEQIKARTLVRHFASDTLARVCLGMIGGVVGGLLFADSEKDSALSTIPPIALPFFFGYAVEVVFTFLDRIVKTFSPESSALAPPKSSPPRSQ
jgi:hypothetical protein